MQDKIHGERNYPTRWGWRSWCCFLLGCLQHSCRGLLHWDPHQRVESEFPVHPGGGSGVVTVVDHLLATRGWEGVHHGLHMSVLLRSPGPQQLVLWVRCAPQREELQKQQSKVRSSILGQSWGVFFVKLVTTNKFKGTKGGYLENASNQTDRL